MAGKKAYLRSARAVRGGRRPLSGPRLSSPDAPQTLTEFTVLIVYTGSGKGKTSASVGQAVRAHGQGLAVAFAQFMKRPDQAGEQTVLASLLGDRFFVGGRGFFRKEESRAEHRQAALAVFSWSIAALEGADMLVLDESLYALQSGLLLDEELRTLVAAAKQRSVHLVLSGRGLPDWLRDEADIVTEMTLIRHAFTEGQKAVKGIEF